MVREGHETDGTRLGLDADERAFVEAADDVMDICERPHVDPAAALALAGVGLGVGLDVERRPRQIRAEHFEHGLDHLGGALPAELADEDAQGGGVARLVAAGALVAEGVAVAIGALPGNLASG